MVATTVSAVTVAETVTAVGLAKALRVGVLYARALPCDTVRRPWRVLGTEVVHKLTRDAKSWAAKTDGASLWGDPCEHVGDHVPGESAQLAPVIPLVAENG